ncbi:hypothetical protein FCG40_05485 [Fimbriimonadia bacterium ATM]|nr:MAG: hypothetical protein EDM73_07610 [Armatimonadota bacterium]MBC6969959.1 hypothetical protein [Armatimonadota bacterium]MCE7900267.1 hypothetical protein [Armatimonadetes bacterium ATM1]MDL1928423.1 hypothetical protein [Fimbriimonadia bacterium ATM]RIJ96646.1 MAG: hypothetical protein DCC45_06360 [Armatimonadota bacterium]
MEVGKIRKQVYDLILEDLDRHPVWEFALDEEGEEGQDEATVRPYEVAGSLDARDGIFVVRASFALADGTFMRGYLTPPTPEDLDLGTIQPAIVTDGGPVSFWYGVVAPDQAEIAAAYACLGKSSPLEVFPLTYQSEVELVGGPVSGVVPGFLVMEDSETRRTRVIQ